MIAKDTVLTAAHCMGDPFSVRVGSDDVDGGELIKTRRVLVHPDYDDKSDKFDMALVFLEEPTRFDIDLVQVNDNNNIPATGAKAMVTGWGDMDAGDSTKLPDELMAVELDIISNQQCEASEKGSDSYDGWIFDSMLCAQTKGQDACQGDSGKLYDASIGYMLDFKYYLNSCTIF